MSKLKKLDGLFAGRQFDRDVIILCVRWYLRYKLSLRDLVEMMADRGLSLPYTTILRWVRRYTPEFVKRWNRFATPAGRSWRVDEIYLKIRGRSVPGGGSGWPDGRLHAPGKARCGCGKSLFRGLRGKV
jgi:transposase-like protein